ncbi:MAG: ribbon-helix-helix domain-containing protein [Vulcanisaeta sp.]|nr:ribbon-helix-helix domain-containing protein [Vulcanisaeta sp.]
MVNPTITVRLGEEELRRLDELAQRMGKTRSDVIRDLIGNFDEALKQQVEVECRKAFAIGFASALELVILDPEVVLRFVRRNVDVLGYPDFLVGMVRVRNRVVVFSHQDRVGSQLINLVRGRVEKEIRREETEIEREDDEEEGTEDGKPITVHVPVRTGVRPSIPRGAPVPSKYKLLINSRGTPPTPRPIVADVGNRPTTDSEGGNAKAASNASVAEKQKSATTGIPTSTNPVVSQTRDSSPQPSSEDGGTNSVRPVGQGLEDGHGGGSGKGVPSPVGQGITHGLSGDFVFALVTQSYHKHRDKLLKLMESIAGD